MVNVEGVIGFKPLRSFWNTNEVNDNTICWENGFVKVQGSFRRKAKSQFYIGIEVQKNIVRFLGDLKPESRTSFFTHDEFISDEDNSGRLKVWYSEPEQRLTISRDLFGAIPCFFIHEPGQFVAFSSSITSLISMPLVSKRHLSIDIRRLASFVTFRADHHTDYSENTFFDHIKAVLPGHVLDLSTEQSDQKPNTKLVISDWVGDVSQDDYGSAFSHLLSASVSRHIDEDALLGAHLSGGLDSSSVASLVKKIHPQRPLHTLYYSTRYYSDDDHLYAKTVADSIGSIHHEVQQENNELALIQKYTIACGQPQMGIVPPTSQGALMQLASKLGCNVLLNGSGGDSIVGSGLESVDKAFKEKNWPLLKELLRKRVSAFSYADHYSGWEQMSVAAKESIVQQNFLYNRLSSASHSIDLVKLYHLYRELSGNFNISLGYMFQRSASGMLKKFQKRSILPASLLKDDFRALLNQPVEHKRSFVASLRGDLPDEYHQDIENIFNQHTILLNEEKFALGNYYGLRNASPFFDKALFELCLAIPAEIKFGDGRGRGHFRNAMKNTLPESVRNRSQKATIGTYGRDATLRLYDQAYDFLHDNSEIWTYIDPKAFEETFRFLKRDGLAMHEYNRSMFHITRIVSLACWLSWLHTAKS
ncbi:asparagine synthase-related protein [Dyadobacter sandarakinus]|uniref:asparagine synthase (glutamine-hydrolyzing) n=1 Tax=Dyadobacter sandarakinus TaxID=2747268 RepID=A0ABX7IF36_9BACT|nr:asparagine synthase-related protein [Dyadobacter sandarakinus]QRR03486.1 hypothetical protein HWI92_22515 [Dyadobacter sandarakinus]